LPDEVIDGSKVCDGGRFEALIQVKGRAFSIALVEFHALAEVVGPIITDWVASRCSPSRIDYAVGWLSTGIPLVILELA
jgi:hypothetical protein